MEHELRQLPFWPKLEPKEREYLIQTAGRRSFQKKDLIHSHNAQCLGMFRVLKGIVRIFILSEEGREVTLFRVHEGETCVLAASCFIKSITFDTQLVAETDCELLVVGGTAFSLLSQNVHVRCYMFEKATEHFSSVMWSMQQILFAKFDQRLATFLLEEHDRTGKSTVKMSQEEIAQHTSSAREVVARMLKRFSADGLVEVRRGEILLKDIPALRLLAY